MDASAQVSFDRSYFDAFYSDWLTYRSKWRRYAVPFAFAITLASIVVLWFLPGQRFFGLFVLCVGLYHVYEAVTHRRRWLAHRLKDLPPDKAFKMSFHPEHIEMETPNSSSRLNIAALSDVVATPNGMFLSLQTGVSIYVPRASIDPPDAFLPLVDALECAIQERRQTRSIPGGDRDGQT
jgi:hypothetical protein